MHLETEKSKTNEIMTKQKIDKENQQRKLEAREKLNMEKEKEKNFQQQKEITKRHREAQKEIDSHDRRITQ